MVLEYLFLISGICIALLLLTKVREQKTHRTPFLLRIISLGDERMKDLSHRTAHFYADSKEDVKFFLEKQLPLHTKNFWNKTELEAREQYERLRKYLEEAGLFRKGGNVTNLAEYFQSLSENENKSEENINIEESNDESHLSDSN